jgi:uncharacterized protein YcbK (DUF882 family)
MTGYTTNLHPELMVVLKALEERLGFELTVNSGYRDPEHNREVGGVEGSEHTDDPAQGADILCKRSVTRFKMVRELLSMGVRRIGIGNTFVHVGIASDKPQDVMWDYYPEESK